MKTRYYYDDETQQLYVVDQGMLSALDVGEFWDWVCENKFNVISVTTDHVDHTGEHIQGELPYDYDNAHEFIVEQADANLMEQYIGEVMPQTLTLIELV